MSKEILQIENSPENTKKILANYHKKIWPFYYSRGVQCELQSKHTKISCRIFLNPDAKSKVIIVNGYNESYLKYAEVIFDLYQKGYSVYAYDHRGQGFSQKFPNQQNRGFINKFSELVDDLEVFFNFVNKHNEKLPIFMIAHSMGGAVASMAICENRISPERLVLSAPMFGISLGIFSFLEYPVYMLSKILVKFGFGKSYAFGQTDCFPLTSFKKNELTHSLARYQIWQTHIRETPDVQLGGPTFQWIYESLDAIRKIRLMGQTNKIPILLLQAENDTVVLNSAQNIFVQNCAHVEKKVIHHAKHEILMEIDPIRVQVFNYIFDFFTF